MKENWNSELKELIKRENWFPNFDLDWDESFTEGMYILWLYMNGDPEFEKMGENFSLGKGVCLQGGTGVGKDTMMIIMNRWLHKFRPERVFRWSAVHEVQDLIKKDYLQYFKDINTLDYYFADIGNQDEERIIDFGRKLMVSERIIVWRYNYFSSPSQRITHFTTNHTHKALKGIFDSKTMSRLREMCNWIIITGPDRRENSRVKNNRQMLNIDPTHDSVPKDKLYEGLVKHWEEHNKLPLACEWTNMLSYIVSTGKFLVKDELRKRCAIEAANREKEQAAAEKSTMEKTKRLALLEVPAYMSFQTNRMIIEHYFINNLHKKDVNS